MTRDEALELFNNSEMGWITTDIKERGYYNFKRIAPYLELERRTTQKDFFYFQSKIKLSDEKKLYGLWIQHELEELLAKFPDCKCLKVTMTDKESTQPAEPEEKSQEAHIAMVKISDDQEELKATSKDSLRNALNDLNELINDMKNRNVKSLVEEFNTGVDIHSYAEDRLQRKSHVGKTYNKVYPTTQKGKSGTSGNDISPVTNLPRNLIYFGAPGTGKSYKLKDNVERLENHFVDKDKDGKPRYERVTFYPTYSYAQFVGCYKPVMEETKREKNSESLSPEQLTEELKKSLVLAGKNANSDIDPSAGKIVSILLFGEKYYDSLGKLKPGDRNKILKEAGATTKADPVYFGHGITMGKIHSERNDGTIDSTIAYKFVPGPFLRILVRALNNPDNDYCLVIEEINRANAAAVFGDVFQLLDRTSKDSDDGLVRKGESEYEIAVSEDVKKFLKDNGIEKESLRIPQNMYIWATMNSADQGVFPLDTAFKRRWEFEYVDIDNGEDKGDERKLPPNEWIVEGKKHKYLWNEVRKYINGLLSDNGVNEDKQMGARFVTASKAAEGGKLFSVVSSETFKSKVLMYLWEDAARMCRQKIFANGIKTFSKLQDEWDDKGVYIFLKKDGQDTKLPKDLMPSKPDKENNDEVGKTGTEG